MKKLLVLLALFVAVLSSSVPRVIAETVTWQNPTTYTDNSAIPAAKQAQLSTEIQYRMGATFLPFGTATGGAETFAAPYVTAPGTSSYWRIRSISVADNNSTGAWSGEHTFSRPFSVPGAGQVLDVR